MFYKKIGFVISIALFLPNSLSALTLGDTLVSAYQTSGLIEQNRALLRAADEDVAQTVSQLRPIINWSADFTQEFGRAKVGPVSNIYRKVHLNDTTTSLGITGSLLLYDFGKVRYEIEAAKETVLATRQSLISIEQEVLLRATFAHMEVLRAQQVVELRQNNLRVLKEELRATLDRFEVGEVTRTDIAQSEARVAAARSGLAVAEGDLERANAEYVAAVGRKPENLKWPEDYPRVKGGEPKAMEIARIKHPDYLAAQHNVKAAELNISVATLNPLPDVTLFGQAYLDDNLDNKSYDHGARAGVSAEGPIYQGGRLDSIRRKAINLRDAQLGNLHNSLREINKRVSSAFASLGAAIAAREASDEEVRAAKVAFDGVRDEAQLGARTTIDVLNAEQDYLDARVTRVSANVEVYRAAYSVIFSMGEMTVRDLKLKTQTYDPTVYYNRAKKAPNTISPQGKQLERVLKSLGKK